VNNAPALPLVSAWEAADVKPKVKASPEQQINDFSFIVSIPYQLDVEFVLYDCRPPRRVVCLRGNFSRVSRDMRVERLVYSV
jgi:hypothetical protein